MTDTELFYARRRNKSIEWAMEVLASPDDYVIFDTETTGLKDSDVIIHFAVMDLSGNMLIDSLVKPMSKRRMSQDAQYVHGLTMNDLKGAPLFEDVVALFQPIASSKKLLCFNAQWHADMFSQTYYNEGVSGQPIKLDCYDVKEKYEKFMGQTGLALPGRKNTGVGDCTATLNLIKKMAIAELVDLPPEPENTTSSIDYGTLWMIGLIVTGIGLGSLTHKWGWCFVIMLIGVFIYMGTERKNSQL